jgi:hypothetical protein
MLQRKTSHVTVIVLIRKKVQQSLYRPGQALRFLRRLRLSDFKTFRS